MYLREGWRGSGGYRESGRSSVCPGPEEEGTAVFHTCQRKVCTRALLPGPPFPPLWVMPTSARLRAPGGKKTPWRTLSATRTRKNILSGSLIHNHLPFLKAASCLCGAAEPCRVGVCASWLTRVLPIILVSQACHFPAAWLTPGKGNREPGERSLSSNPHSPSFGSEIFPFELPSEHLKKGAWWSRGVWPLGRAAGQMARARLWVGARQPHRILGTLLPLSDQPAVSPQRVCPPMMMDGVLQQPSSKSSLQGS